MISKETSYSITNTKYFLTFLIVCLHCRLKASEILGASNLFKDIDVGIGMFCDCAVPGFFFISAFLFFANFDIAKYFDKVLSRVRSLIIPFVMFSFLGLCHHCITHLVKGENDISSLQDVITAVLTQKYNGPIWYLLSLFHFILCSPALFFFIDKYEKKGAVLLSVLFVVINLFVKISYTSIFFWMPVLVIGAYIGLMTKKGRSVVIPGYYGLFLFPLFFVTYFYWEGNFYSPIYYMWRILGGIIVVVLGKYFTWKPFAFEKYMMFVFMTQIMVKSLAIVPKTMEFSLVKAVEVMLIGTIIAMLLKKVLPSLYNVMTGSR